MKQNEGYDVLLDEDRRPLAMNPGEIGVPVILLDEFDIAIGDTLTLCSGGMTKEFTVHAYVYDGQMKDELRLGKYKDSEQAQREQSMQKWLEVMKF